MVRVFAEVAAGRAKWEETLPLRELSAGQRIHVRDLVHLMIVVSDNTAANLLLDRFTAGAVNELLDSYGLTATRSLRKVRGNGSQLQNPSGWSKAGRVATAITIDDLAGTGYSAENAGEKKIGELSLLLLEGLTR
jgi:beta-lactamase class A